MKKVARIVLSLNLDDLYCLHHLLSAVEPEELNTPESGSYKGKELMHYYGPDAWNQLCGKVEYAYHQWFDIPEDELED